MSLGATAKVPVLFVAHGNPMNALGESAFARQLMLWGQDLPRPEALLAISAHWRAPEARITTSPRPATIHDFQGFPEVLGRLDYPAPGAPGVAREALRLLESSGFKATADETRGLDHGVWSPLRHLFPDASIPVAQLSLLRAPPARHLALGEALAPLRADGVMVLGSGNIVHNLATAVFADVAARVPPWAREFDDWVAARLLDGDHAALAAFETRGPHAARAQPTDEHYLPLLVAAGAAGTESRVSFPCQGFEHGSISLRSVRFD